MKKSISTILKEDDRVVEEKASNNPIFDRKVEVATEGLLPYFSRTLYNKIPQENALTIANYIISMKTEINPNLTNTLATPS